MGVLGQPSLLAFVLACALWLLLGVVPGLLVATWLAPERSRLERLAVAPLVSIVLAFAPAAWLSTLRVPQAAQAAWVVPLVVSVVLLALLGRRGDLRGLVARSRTAAVVGLAVAASTVLWVVGIAMSTPGWSTVIPDQDGGSHGVFVTRILLTGSVSPDRVAVFDLADPGAVTVFYPLGVHALAAPVAALTSVASALLVPLTVLGSASLVVGSAALARRAGGERLVAPAAVVAAVLLPWFPFAQSFWGPVPMVLALSCVPGLVLALLAVDGRRSLLLAALAVGGMLALHTTEALVALGIVVLAVLLGQDAARGRALARTAGALVLGAVVVGPVLGGLLAGGASRPQEPAHGGDPVVLAVWGLLRPAVAVEAWAQTNPVLIGVGVLAGVGVMALAVAGAVRLRRSPLATAVAVAVLGCLVIGVTARAGWARPLSIPWYGNADRLASQAAALLPALVASGWTGLRDRQPSTAGRRITAIGAAALAVVLLSQAWSSVVDDFSRYSVVTAEDRDAWAWLAEHSRPGERVLNDHRDGSLWMYDATRGAVAPVFGPKPSGGWEEQPYFARALHLRDHVGQLASDPAVREDVEALDVRYVVVGSRRFEDVVPLLDVGAIEKSPAFREVYRSGDARVFEIVGR